MGACAVGQSAVGAFSPRAVAYQRVSYGDPSAITGPAPWAKWTCSSFRRASRPQEGTQAYAEGKFLDVLLAFRLARHWPDVLSNALEPG